MEVAAVAARGRAAPALLPPRLRALRRPGPPRPLPLHPRARSLEWPGPRCGGVASSSACVARRCGLELCPRGLEPSGDTGDGDELAAAAYGPRRLAALSLPPLPLPLSLSLLRRSDPAPGSRDQAAGPQAGCGRTRRPAGCEEPRACAARSRRGVASPSGGEERAAGRMGSASRRPLVAGWTGTIFSDDVATVSFLLLVQKSYCKIADVTHMHVNMEQKICNY